MPRLTHVAGVVAAVLMTFAVMGEDSAVRRGEPLAFQTEVTKMLDILINSLYTNRNIFLREIISNASDALDKVRFMYLTAPKSPVNDKGEEPTMDIRITLDKKARTFVMRDGGIGMTKEELEKNLGSIGSSGTKEFLEKMKEGKDSNLIGQFGVGFYSVFLVADKVQVASKSDKSDKQYVWESSGDGQFFVYEDPRGNTLGRGTELTLFLKKDAEEYLSNDKIAEIIHRYSEFIHFPIYLRAEQKEEPEKKEPAEEEKKTEEDDTSDEEKKTDSEEDAAKKEEEAKKKKEDEYVLVNQNKPIWTRPVGEVSEKEYNDFFKAISKAYSDPLYYNHFSAEGSVVFTGLLFVPSKNTGSSFDQKASNIRLYVRRVFITDEFRDMLPRYLNFVIGVVDSDDLPLNVSREILQENRILKLIKKKLVRKALSMFQEMADSDDLLTKKLIEKGMDPEDYSDEKDVLSAGEEVDEKQVSAGGKKLRKRVFNTFWEEFGKNIRLGVVEDTNNRAQLVKLLRYTSSKSPKTRIPLQTYVDRMQPKQKSIYFISGASMDRILQTPVLEDALRRDVEVLYMTDPIDEYVVHHVPDFKGKKLVNLAKEGATLDDESKREKALHEKRMEKYEPLFKWLHELLGERITKCVITKRITNEPMILSSRAHDRSARMVQLLREQAIGAEGHTHGEERQVKRVVEINHLHPLIDEIFNRIQVNPEDEVAKDLALVLFDVANLQNGFEIVDTLLFSRRINRLLRSSVDIAPDAPFITEDLSQYNLEDKKEESEENEDDEDLEDL